MAKVALNTMVAAETMEAIRSLATGKSQGQVVDEAIAAIQGGDQHSEVNRWFRETWTRLDEILETVQTVPSDAASREPGGDIEFGIETDGSFRAVAAPNLPKNATCRHCGNRFAGPKYATICSLCKSVGHTGDLRDCPRCTAGQAI